MTGSTGRYEGLFVLDAELSDEAVGKLQAQLAEQITKAQGAVESQQPWGRRRLAYRVHRRRDGIYLLLLFRMPPAGVRGFDQWCSVQDGILRRLITQASNVSSEPVEASTSHGDAE